MAKRVPLVDQAAQRVGRQRELAAAASPRYIEGKSLRIGSATSEVA
jgi:hypothetical protein